MDFSRVFSERLWLFPVAMFTVAVTGIIIVYIVAVADDDVDAIFPYISEAGSLPPESGIFGIILTITAVLCAVCMLLRHRQLVALYGDRLRVRGHYWRPLSQLCLALGFLSCVGIIIVANFQASNVLSVHMVGAMMAFGIGLLYCWAQTIFSFVMKPRMIPAILLYSRLGMCIFGVLFFITMEVCGFMGKPDRDATNATTPSYRWAHWPHDDAGYPEHIISAACEWLMVACFLFYMLTYAYELRGTRWRGGTIDIAPGSTWDIQTTPLQPPVPVTYLSTRSTPANLTLIPSTPNTPASLDRTPSNQMVGPPTPTPSMNMSGGALRPPSLFAGGSVQKQSISPVHTDTSILGMQRSISRQGSTQRSRSPVPHNDNGYASPSFDYLNYGHD